MESTGSKRIRLTGDEKKKVYCKTGNRCGHCGKILERGDSTIDHIIPLHKGGKNDEYNLIGLCHKCNNDKSNYMYSVMGFYKYILPEYQDNYLEYHSFASYGIKSGTLLGYDKITYTVYPDKQKAIIRNMMKRGAKKSRINSVANRLGIPLYLVRAYTADAEEMMKLIDKAARSPWAIVKDVYYKNEYMLINDIKSGEVYVLRGNDGKIYGVFAFKKIKGDGLPVMQVQNIAETTRLKPQYIMTCACIEYSVSDLFNRIMNDIMFHLIYKGSIPIYFNIISGVFKGEDECIRMPYQLDKVEGTLEFMPLKLIRKIIGGFLTPRMDEQLTDDEMELLCDLIVNYREQSEIKALDDYFVKDLFTKYPLLMGYFKPEKCDLYDVGFGKSITATGT